jgi:hypothetical protein
VKSIDRAAIEYALAEAQSRPGVDVVLGPYGDPQGAAADVHRVALEKGIEANVTAHPNGAVAVVVEADDAAG